MCAYTVCFFNFVLNPGSVSEDFYLFGLMFHNTPLLTLSELQYLMSLYLGCLLHFHSLDCIKFHDSRKTTTSTEDLVYLTDKDHSR